jgi:hypothetical protein
MKLNVKTLADVEIGIPLVTEGVYHARMAKVEVKENKTKDGNNLVVQYKILDPQVTLYKDGKVIDNKGNIVCTRHYSLKPTDNYDPDQSMKELALAIKLPVEEDLTLEALQAFSQRSGPDGIVMVKINHKPEEKDERTGKTYPPGNDVARVTPMPDDDGFQPPPFG